MTQPWPDWKDETAVIIATGPSAKDVQLEFGKGRARFLAIKEAWQLCPWADMLYGCDGHWWERFRGEYTGLKATYSPEIAKRSGFLKVNIGSAHDSNLLFGEIGRVGWGGNSGFHAINLAIQFGSKRLLLVGFDMRVDQGKHFFGEHTYNNRPNEKTVKLWRQILDLQASLIASRGVEVINCSSVSTLQAYPKRSFEECFD